MLFWLYLIALLSFIEYKNVLCLTLLYRCIIRVNCVYVDLKIKLLC